MLSTPAPDALPRARTGCDVQRVDEVAAAVRDFGSRYLDRVYTPLELEAYRTGGPASLAARFAAKEAVLKLIGEADGVDPRSVEIGNPGGRPEVRLSGRAADLARAAGLGPIDVSLSHTGDLALAVAVAVVEPTTPTSAPTRQMTGHLTQNPEEPNVHE
jgi:holo-[acyl-carrier protein] synthase